MAVVALVISDGVDSAPLKAALSAQTHPVDSEIWASSLADAREKYQRQFASIPGDWVWVLTASSIPEPSALASMLGAAERSPSAVWVVPKLYRNLASSKVLSTFGNTLDKFWNPISLAHDQLDQGQHDHREDLLAGSHIGALLTPDVFARLAESSEASSAATNITAGMLLRLQGNRVLACPEAKIDLAGSSLDDDLGSLSAGRLRRTQFTLFSNFQPVVLVILSAFFAPLGAVIFSVWQLLKKSPENIPAMVSAALWWFFRFPILLARRPKLGRAVDPSVLRGLFASRDEVEQALRSVVDAPAALAESQVASEAAVASVRFGAPQFALAAALTAISWMFWPTDSSVTGGSLLPLPQRLIDAFNLAGSSWQPLGFGHALPSDPINWIWLGLDSLTPWQPGLVVTAMLLLAKSVAFVAAWRFFAAVANRNSAATVAALVYALWPAFNQAQLEGRGATVLAIVLLPLFALALLRILGIGQASRVQIWTWVGAGGLLAAAISACAPSLTPVVAAVIIAMTIYRFKRVGYLVWVPIPLLALWLPLALYLVVGLAHPLQLLQEPGVPVHSQSFSLLQLLLGSNFNPSNPFTFTAVPALVVAAIALVTRKAWIALWVWLAVLATVASAFAFNHILFWQQNLVSNLDAQSSHWGSPLAILGLAGLLVATLVVITLDTDAPVLRRIASIAVAAGTITASVAFTTATTQVDFVPSALMPALVRAQADQDPETRVLVVRPGEATNRRQPISVTLVSGLGYSLMNVNTAYSAALPLLIKSDSRYRELSLLAANLVAGNASNIDGVLKRYGIDYVLVPAGGASADAGAAIDTVAQLAPVGTTDFGRLWQVRASVLEQKKIMPEWSLTKQVQLGVIAVFVLLAVPTRRRRPKVTQDDDAHLDAFTAGSEGDEA